MTEPLRIDLDLDDLPWVIGPTEERPYDVWLPEAVALMLRVLDVPRRGRSRAEEYLTAMLGRIGRPDEGPLPYRLVRWLELDKKPAVAMFGLVERDDAATEAFLRSADLPPVEPPVLDDVAAPVGWTVRRALSYGLPDDGLFVHVRYVVDSGHPDAVVWLHCGDRAPGLVVEALDDLDAVAARARVTGSAGHAGPTS